MSLINTVFKSNLKAIEEIAKKHKLIPELKSILSQISEAEPSYWPDEEDPDWVG